MKYIVGNWKMNGEPGKAGELAGAIVRYCAGLPKTVEVVLCPPALLMGEVGEAVAGSPVKLGCQDCHSEPEGAYTGNISAKMVKKAGCSYVITGHSERRLNHGETNEQIRKKAASAVASKVKPIICVGETQSEYEAGRAKEVVKRQVQESVPAGLKQSDFMLAYEPVWAIGSGKTPSADDIRQMHAYILSVLPGADVLYGGSVNGANAIEILAVPGVSGVLVGGASLKADEFCGIIAAAKR